MDRTSTYYRQVQLLVQLLPLVAEEDCFALKGGTAINLFVRNLPRLSVDIDLVYLPRVSRSEALQGITDALLRISARISKVFPEAKITEAFKDKSDALRLIVSRAGVQVKIELSPVLRGTVFEPQIMSVTQKVEDEFGYAEIAVVALADLYAGKICAALDRQHPRDLFDVRVLLQNEGFNNDIRKALIVYLISHGRPLSELLNPGLQEIKKIYESEFSRLTDEDVSLTELEVTREEIIGLVNAGLTHSEKEFLLSFKNKEPKWELLGLENIQELPAVQWKQLNLGKMSETRHKAAYEKLREQLLGKEGGL